MAILINSHVHSNHSGDSTAPMEDMILAGIERGYKAIAFTEHNDFNFPISDETPLGCFDLNVDSYLYELLALREKYQDKIKVLFGIEIGLQTDVFRENAVLAKNNDFDFILGSIHLVGGEDPYNPSFFDGRTDKAAYEEYFKTLVANIRKFKNFDSLAHMDYIVRYGKTKDTEYSAFDYRDYIDEALDILIENEKALELNTGAFRHKMKDANPCRDILKMFKDKGGELITIGSDAHTTNGIMNDDMERAYDILTDLGFKYYALYEKRVPTMIKL